MFRTSIGVIQVFLAFFNCFRYGKCYSGDFKGKIKFDGKKPNLRKHQKLSLRRTMMNRFSSKFWFYLDREPNLLLGSYIWSVTARSLSDSVFCEGGLTAVRHVRFSDERNRAPKSIVAWQILKGLLKFICKWSVIFM